jgi:hypothetical protein
MLFLYSRLHSSSTEPDDLLNFPQGKKYNHTLGIEGFYVIGGAVGGPGEYGPWLIHSLSNIAQKRDRFSGVHGSKSPGREIFW